MPLQPGIGGDVGLDAGEGAQVVDPQAHLPAASMRQAPRQPPANADVAVIVDHAAEDVGPQDAARYQWNWAGAVSASSGSSACTSSPNGFGNCGAPQSSQYSSGSTIGRAHV